MPKKKVHLAAPTKQQRAEQRQKLGSLRSLAVQPGTKKRYDAALSKFFAFLRFEGLALPTARAQMDDIVTEYVEHLWSSGEGRALASDTIAALQNEDAKLKGMLPGSWRLLKIWNQNELPNRAPPLPESVVHALAGWALLHEDHDFALSVLLGFYGMMRTGELLELLPRQVQAPTDKGPAVLSLGLTKGGKRQGASESITISVYDVVRRLRLWKTQSRQKLGVTPAQWRAKFAEGLDRLGLTSFGFRPYSLRRGGATFWFSKHGSFDRLLVQGRWAAPKTARIYINDGLATLAELSLPTSSLRGFVNIYKRAMEQPLPSLERTRTSSRTGGRGKKVKKQGNMDGESIQTRIIFFLSTWDSLLYRHGGQLEGGTRAS